MGLSGSLCAQGPPLDWPGWATYGTMLVVVDSLPQSGMQQLRLRDGRAADCFELQVLSVLQTAIMTRPDMPGLSRVLIFCKVLTSSHSNFPTSMAVCLLGYLARLSWCRI